MCTAYRYVCRWIETYVLSLPVGSWTRLHLQSQPCVSGAGAWIRTKHVLAALAMQVGEEEVAQYRIMKEALARRC